MIYYDIVKMDIKKKKALVYSIDENLTPSQLRKADDFLEFFENPANQHSADKLDSRMEQHNII